MQAVDLIERESQLAELDGWFARTSEGRGGLVLVTGEAGSGKTSLVRAAVERSGVPALVAEATQEATEPYTPIASLIRAHLRTDPDSLAAAGPLSPYLSLIVPEHGSQPVTPSPTTLVDALAAWFAALGGDGPRAVFLDDLQWVDSATIDLLPRLAVDLESVPVVLIAAFRRDEVTRGHAIRKLRVVLRRGGRLTEVDVEPLEAAGTVELASRRLDAAVAPSLGAVLYDRTQGVPFFVEELVAVLSAEEMLVPGEQGLELRSAEEVPVPDTVRDAVLLRVGQLGDGTRSALETAAVVGQRFELDLLDELGVTTDFDRAAALGLVTEAQSGTAAFRHALVREAVYAAVPWARKRDTHRRVAASLGQRGAPPRLVAEHWLAGGENDLARDALVAAADASCAVHAYRDASAALRKAIELWREGDDEARVDLSARLARCAERAGELREAVALWEGMIRELEPSQLVRRAEAKRNLATCYRLLGEVERAAALRVEAAETFTAAGAFAEAAEVRLYVAWSRERDPVAPFDVLDAAERDAVRAERPDLVSQVHGLRAHLLARRGYFDQAAALAREALELARSTGVATAIYDAYFRLAAIGVTRADYDDAVAVLEEASAFCRANGLRSDEEFCMACITKILMKQGQWDRALELADNLVETGDPAPHIRWAALWTAGLIRVSRGQTGEGRPLLEELTTIGRRLQFDPALIEGLQALAVADEVDGDLETAAGRGRELLGAVGPSSTEAHHFAPTLRWAAAFFASQRDAEQVSACADALADMAERFGSPDLLAALAHTLGEAALLDGDAREAADQFGRAIALLEQADMPFEAALTKLRAAPALVAAGEREVGVDYLVDAYRCFRKLGAKPFAVRTTAVLEELGERIDRRLGRRATGELERGGLTRRELEVLRLVAIGRTNAEIARELVLSPRTVEMHVRHTLAKLDCRSRTEATARAHTLGLVGGATATTR